MAEKIAYTTPQYAAPAATDVEIIGFEIHIKPSPFIRILLMEDGGRIFDAYYREDEGAQALIIALNKANLTTKSLLKRLMEKLLADGKLAAGAITGSPD